MTNINNSDSDSDDFESAITYNTSEFSSVISSEERIHEVTTNELFDALSIHKTQYSNIIDE